MKAPDVLPHGLKPKKKWDIEGLKRANWNTVRHTICFSLGIQNIFRVGSYFCGTISPSGYFLIPPNCYVDTNKNVLYNKQNNYLLRRIIYDLNQ